jgi:transcription elongation factor Elf1|tara:strand:+ start:4591 stop:4752 length:162 start_codon:yes stop_codon:yes gene_type:complete
MLKELRKKLQNLSKIKNCPACSSKDITYDSKGKAHLCNDCGVDIQATISSKTE